MAGAVDRYGLQKTPELKMHCGSLENSVCFAIPKSLQCSIEVGSEKSSFIETAYKPAGDNRLIIGIV